MAADNDTASRVSAPPQRPTIILPPRTSFENFFSGFASVSPGPMTLVSSFFSDNYPDTGCRSFSQLLAGAMSSPGTVVSGGGGGGGSFVIENSNDSWSTDGGSVDGGEKELGFKQSRPMSLVVARSPLFTVPPGLSPSGFLNSPGLFSPGQSPFGMSHQQALAQVTAQAALSQSRMYIQAGYQPSSLAAPAEELTNHSSFTTNATTDQQMPLIKYESNDPKSSKMESSEVCHTDKKHQLPSLALDKPADDGYNWRKYGQKQVKGGEYPRSYYKCTHLNCPVKKKVERSLEGQIVEIIYKGQHDHDMPQLSKRAKDGNDFNGHVQSQAKPKLGRVGPTGNLNRSNATVPAQPTSAKDQESSQATSIQTVESSDCEEIGDNETRKQHGNNDEEPHPKRRNTEVVASEPAPSQKTVTEQRIIVQTRSEVDLLDDGFRWRKYGQKVVKGNPHPRSYYKCTSAGCNVRKHVERASTDSKAVITTYEGKHNHDLPAARNSNHNTANSNASRLKPHKLVPQKHASLNDKDFGNNEQRPVAVLQLKEEETNI